MDHDDKLSASPNARLDGSKFTFTRVDIKSKTKKVKVDFDTTRKKTSNLNKGVTKIDTPGVSGVRAVTYRLVRHNGEIVSRTKIKSKLIKKPVTEVILVGTKTTVRKSSGSSLEHAVGQRLGQARAMRVRRQLVDQHRQWLLRRSAIQPQHLARVRRLGMPHEASREEQIAIAKKLQADAGWGAWPACSSKLGLR